MNNNHQVTFLELVLRLHGEFRRRLEPIRVTPLQAGVLLYLQRCTDAPRVNEVACHLQVRPPTMTDVLHDLVRKRWVFKRQSAEDGRVFRLRLSRQGQAIARRIEHQVRHMETTPTADDGCALGISIRPYK